MIEDILERFEKSAPVSVMARAALEYALPPDWIDTVFEEHRTAQYSRQLLFSTLIKLMSRVTLGFCPSVHAAAQKIEDLPVSLAALYAKIQRTEPDIMRALLADSAQRLKPVMDEMGVPASLPGWHLRIVDGNHLPASERRLDALRHQSAAALPGQTLVVYDPDYALITDLVACEDAYTQERSFVSPLVADAGSGELWMADRNFCTRTILQGWDTAGAGFVVREHGRHPRLVETGPWQACGRNETGEVHEQTIAIDGEQTPWRRIALTLNQPTESGETRIRLWTNLPARVSACQIAQLYRKRWHIEGMFQRLELVLNSEIRTLGHPCAALLGFAVAATAYNAMAVLQRSIEQAHRQQVPALDVSPYYLAVDIQCDYHGLLVALPDPMWADWANAAPAELARYLLTLAGHIKPHRVRTRKRGPKIKKTKAYVSAKEAKAHVSTARELEKVKNK